MVKILTIGNSFAGDATELLPRIAAADGLEQIQLGYANLGGCSLEKHCNVLRQCALFPGVRPYDFHRTGLPMQPATLLEALTAEDWDYVTMQQASRLSWQPESYEPFFGQLMQVVAEHAPAAQVIIHQTWAYRVDAPFFAEHGIDQATMQAGLLEAYGAMASRYGLPLIPVGQAFALARQALGFQPDPHFTYSDPQPGALPDQTGSLQVGWKWVTGNTPDGNAQFTIDPAHCSILGRYLGAAVWYEMFTGRAIADTTFAPEEIDGQTLAILRQAAHQAVEDVGGPLRQRVDASSN